MTLPVALTGTPGTGKSSVARHLGGLRVVEVADLARRWGLAGPPRGGIEVDLGRFVRASQRPGALADVEVVVGHLAHFLPLRDVVVLRCHPLELERRLRGSHRGNARDRIDNVVAEATDLVLAEALGRRRRVRQVDTTGRPVASVAREVARFVRSRARGGGAVVDWLGDPAVTEYLLDRAP